MQLIGLVLVLGSLVILFFQNRTPEIAIQFLGLQTVALPLAVWVVTATALGLFVGWLIAGLLQMTFVFYKPRFNLGRRATPSTRYDSTSEEDRQTWVEGDDDLDEDIANDMSGKNRVYEAPQSPRVSLQDGSRYSYSYRDSRQRDLDDEDEEPDEPDQPELEAPRVVGKTVDAEYRVLVPPPPESGVRFDSPRDRMESDWAREERDTDDWDFNDRASRRDQW